MFVYTLFLLFFYYLSYNCANLQFPISLHEAEGPFKFNIVDVAKNLPSKAHWIISADFNNDGKPDIISIGFADAPSYWFENTGEGREFLKHPLVSKLPGIIHMDSGDVNGDGYLDVIVANNWNNCFMNCTEKDGSIYWLENPGKDGYDNEWKVHVIVEFFGTGVHRVNFLKRENGGIDVLGSGMVGANSNIALKFLDKVANQVLYSRPPLDKLYTSPWKPKILSNTLHLVHETYPESVNGIAESILAAGFNGVTRISLESGHHQSLLDADLRPDFVDQAGWISSFAYKAYPTLTTEASKSDNFYAAIEPLHGNQLVIYQNNERVVLDVRKFLETKAATGFALSHHVHEHGGHDVIMMDVDCDGQNEILVAWRGSESVEGKGLVIYKLYQNRWVHYRVIHASFNNFVVADFNGDGINDIGVSGWGTCPDDHRIVLLYNSAENCLKLVS